MFDVVGEINWLAVSLAAVAHYILGAVWYTPLFGRAWDRATGHERRRGESFPPIYYVVPLIGSVLVSIATAVLVRALHIERLEDAVVLALVVGVGYSAAVSFTNAVTPNTPRPLLFGAVTASYHLLGILLVAVILLGLG